MEWSVNNTYKPYKEDLEPKSVMDMRLIPSTNAIDEIDIGLGSSEKGNATVPITKRKKTMTSVYLKFFETAPDGKSRRCKFCGQSYSIATATGNLGRHLANRHPGYESYDKMGDAIAISIAPVPLQVHGLTHTQSQTQVQTPVTTTTIVKKPQPQTQPQQVKSPQLDYDHLNWLLIKWLISASLPPSTLDEKWLTNSYKFLNPSIQVWPCDRYRAVFREVFRSMQEDARATVEKVSSKISITLYFWTSYEHNFYMSVTCQWIDETWSFQKLLLDICHIPYPCGGSEIYQNLIKVLKLYNIESRVLSCTHDNSQNAIHACHTLKEELDGKKVGPFCYMPCAARTLNLIIDDGLRATKPVISKIREFVLELNSSIEMSEDFIKLTTAYQEGNWKIPLDASTRWSGNYKMLDISRKAAKSMDTIIRKYDEPLGNRMLLSVAEKNAVNIVHQYLEPFDKILNNICTSKVPTVGLVLFFMDHISETVNACRESRVSPDWLKSAADDMVKKAKSYGNQVSNIFTYMTAVLDPRIKSELIPESLNSETFLEEARTHFLRNYSASHFSSMTTTGYVSQEIIDGGIVSFAEEIARKKRRASISNPTDELTQYLSEPPAPMPTDVLDWWKVNNTRYPRLSIMARDFLAVQATSVAPEELFCSKGDEIDKQRFCMPHDSTQAVLCIKSWTESGFKLKYRSTEIDYERLMELAAAIAGENSSCAVSEKKPK